MTDKERLEDIDVVHYEEDEDGNNFVLLKEEDYWFLKEQAERVQELEESNKTNADQVARCERGVTRLVMSNIRHVDENNRLHKELVKRVEIERSHKSTYRKVARRYQVERNRYRKAMVEAREASSCCGLTAGAILDEALEGQE